ncbi:uncharacterized protein F5891DRAFT_1194580 [Suillus fuscotomentosus]|uniref:Uncharacterized protein n=1 Tax=Suillus fuscotomentosus TaxID=1912939 RepID=A0AAD4DVT4_9AGAM|nr:uncharacterized protein F5891DRAFT_1194580 [Suillus fuscotomentosus]KAG1895071.1 hypothetical protein F5891DRAFT_1194580 [Suillus fuscotomentosus]
MADGSLVQSQGIWKSTIKWGSTAVYTSFEVFDSGGMWKMLIGKPLLEQLCAVHDYAQDIISIPSYPKPSIVTNLYNSPSAPMKGMPAPPPKQSMPIPVDRANAPMFLIATIPADVMDTQAVSAEEQHVFELSSHLTQSRIDEYTATLAKMGAHIVVASNRPKISMVTESSTFTPCSPSIATVSPSVRDDTSKENNIWPIHMDASEHLGEIPNFPKTTQKNNVYTRNSDPFNKDHIAEVLKSIMIGEDLSTEQRQQRAYLYERLNELESAGIIRRIAPEEVKAASPTVLAQKAHGSEGLPFEE